MKLTIALIAASGAAQVPPPPPVVPTEFREPVNGYDLAALYGLWRHWIEAHKDEAIDATLAQPPGEAARWSGPPIVEFSSYNDFGRYVAGQLRRYCVIDQNISASSGCRIQMRRAYVPLSAAVYDETNAIADWMRGAFDPQKLTSYLRETGMAPDTDWWMADRAAIFAALPSPVPILRQHAELVVVESGDCPAMLASLEEIDATSVDWRVNLFGVGAEEKPPMPPRPHAVQTNYTLRFVAADGDQVTVEGGSAALQSMIGPTLQAAEECEANSAASVR